MTGFATEISSRSITRAYVTSYTYHLVDYYYPLAPKPRQESANHFGAIPTRQRTERSIGEGSAR